MSRLLSMVDDTCNRKKVVIRVESSDTVTRGTYVGNDDLLVQRHFDGVLETTLKEEMSLYDSIIVILQLMEDV